MGLDKIIDKTLVKFIIAGLINTGIGAAIMFCLYNLLEVNYWLSSAANYAAGSIVSFFLNKYFTFAVKEWTLFMIAAFIVNIAAAYFIAYGMAKPAMDYILRSSPQRIRENTALLAGMCLFTGINYVGQRFVVFRRKPAENRQ
jgi:putative flippase GtrA